MSAATAPQLTVRMYDFIVWVTARAAHFPREYRFILGNRLLDTAYGCHDRLVQARKVTGVERANAQLAADVLLESLRTQLLTAQELRCIDLRQYEHGAGLLNEIGRMLGAWRKGQGMVS